MDKLTHINEQGRAKMVDVSEKDDTRRLAVAQASVRMKPATLELIAAGGIAKGDVLAVAQVAGVLAAKETSRLIPMCHPLFITAVDICFTLDNVRQLVKIKATVGTTGKTGVEMEALTAVSVAALTIYDMCKAIDKEMEIGDVCLLEKQGGTSGDYRRIEGGEEGRQ
ncbi:MAG: cyclic pyranopterin monophosphate synthase MoaC [Firmicutes bacterium]|nr:cyclic pyranopterin monophosphate synthase MoaC [Bacillota bacterium]MCL5994349.1 cyclic pyranopterin monophosphate synthase MoaC [Bacillota bacterium]